MSTLEAFNQHRPLLFSIAYWMLGTVMDAEDMVHETFLRWQQVPQQDVRSPFCQLQTLPAPSTLLSNSSPVYLDLSLPDSKIWTMIFQSTP